MLPGSNTGGKVQEVPRMRRFLSGALAAGATMGMIALVVYPVNVLARSWAARRLADDPSNVTAEAVLLGF